MSGIISGCKNYFFSPPAALSKEQSLQEALRTNKWDQVDQLVQTGANPAGKDAYGHSAIDYAIWDGQTQKLPHLLGSNQNFAASKVDARTLSSFTTFINSSGKAKDFISKLPTDKILESNNSQEYIEYEKLLNQSAEVKIQPMDRHFVHLLALFASPKLLLEALKLHPEWMTIADGQGNTVLHYAAFNPDENMFVELVKNGANCFAPNSKKELALTLLVDQIQKRDPLNWNSKDVYIFLGKWVSEGTVALLARGLITSEMALTLALPLQILGIASSISYMSIFMDSSKSKWQKTLIGLAYFGTAWIPVANLPIQAYITYCFAKNAYTGLKNAWQQLGHRPIKAICTAAVKVSNAKDQIEWFSMHWKIASLFYDFKQSLESACGSFPKNAMNMLPHSLYDKESYEKMANYTICANAQFANTLEQELTNNPFAKDNFFTPYKDFADEALRDCAPAFIKDEYGFERLSSDPVACIMAYANHHFEKFFESATADAASAAACKDYSAPWSIGSLSLKERLEKIDKPACLQAAYDILQGTSCREAKKLMHPDKHPGEAEEYSALFQKLAQACDTIAASKK